MKEYSLSDISAALDQKDSAIRRWGNMLENAGHQFSKNNRPRTYSESDLELFKKVKELTKGITAEAAAAIAFQLVQNPPNHKTIDLDSEIAELDELIRKFNVEFFWNGEKSLLNLQEKFEKLKVKYLEQCTPAIVEKTVHDPLKEGS